MPVLSLLRERSSGAKMWDKRREKAAQAIYKCLYIKYLRHSNGGESGIRTHGRVSPTHAFQACSFNHSDISPSLESYTCGADFADCDRTVIRHRKLENLEVYPTHTEWSFRLSIIARRVPHGLVLLAACPLGAERVRTAAQDAGLRSRQLRRRTRACAPRQPPAADPHDQSRPRPAGAPAAHRTVTRCLSNITTGAAPGLAAPRTSVRFTSEDDRGHHRAIARGLARRESRRWRRGRRRRRTFRRRASFQTPRHSPHDLQRRREWR